MLNPQAVEFLEQKHQSDNLLKLAHQQLSAFSESEDFWTLFDEAFGTEYDRSTALELRSQWQTGDFSQFPEVEIVSSSTVGNANASYDRSTDRIYLSDAFVNMATTKTLISTLLKEYGNFVGDRIDSRSVRGASASAETLRERGNNANLEKAIFATLVEGSNLDDVNLSAPLMGCNCQLCQKGSNLDDVNLSALTAEGNLATIGGRSFGALQSIVPPSNDSRINALLGGYKWGVTTLSYSFYGGGSYYGSETGVASVSAAVKQNVRDFLKNAIEPLINVNFVEVSDSATSYGQLRYLTSQDAGYAYAYYPTSTDANQGNSNDVAGDIFLDPDYDNTFDSNGFQGGLGNHGYTTLIHETLHALGLKHPGDYNGGGAGTGPFLPFAQDNLDNTVMTYNFGGASPGTPMAYDLLALQYLYGARSFNTSSTTYTFTQTDLYSDGIKTVGSSTKDTKLTIWDTAGSDTLDFSALAANTGGYRFDLNQGGWLTTQAAFNGSTGTARGDTSGASYSMTTAGTRLGFGVDIEKATGTSSNDLFYGNSLDNYFYGRLGSDTLYGGGGNDVAIYAGTSAQYNITSVGGLFTITDSIANRDGVDTLDSIESIQFSDTTIALISSTLPTLSIDNVTIVEGNSGTKNAVFTVTRSGTATTAISVTYTTADGTATAGIDFTSMTGLLTFAVNETTKTISIPILGDTNIEGNEIFFINLSNPINATIADGQGQGTIENDDPVTISNDNFVNRYTLTGNIASATANNVSATGEAGELSHAGVATPINSLWWTWTATANGNVTISTAGSNFDTTLGVYTGSSVSSLTTIASNDDITPGTNLASLVTFAAVSGTSYQIAVDGFQAATGNINLALNFTPTLANITLVQSPSSVNEDGTTNLVYTFTRTGSITNALTVNYGVGGTATFNTDYTQLGAASFAGTAGTITFAANSATATLTIDPKADTIVEGNETVAITLAAGTGYSVGTTTAVTGTIINDDTAITLSIAPGSVNEDGTTNLIYTFKRTGITTNALTVNYGVGGSATFNTDYTQVGAASFAATTGKITFAANSATATLTIDPKADTIFESNETVAITLAAGTGYSVGTTTAVTGTIINDDTAITLSIAPGSVNEDGTTNLIYTFKRTGITTNALTVNYGVAGSATFNTDYTQVGAASFAATTGKITFAANSATATLTIDPKADTIVEGNETVAITLAAGTGYTVGTTTAVTGTIINDDTAITLSIAPGSVNEDGTTNLIYTFKRTGITTNALTVNYGVAGSATFNTDYTQVGAASFAATTGKITFAANSATATLTIDPKADLLVEGNETVAITLAAGTGYTVGTTTAVTGTIINDDTAIGKLVTGKLERSIIEVRDVLTGQNFAAAGIESETLFALPVAAEEVSNPVVIANSIFENYLDLNSLNQVNRDIFANSNYLGTNSDRVDLFGLLGDNRVVGEQIVFAVNIN